MLKSNQKAYEEADTFCKEMREAREKALRGDQSALQRLKSAVAPGLYEHFKSADKEPKLYAVLRVTLEVDTLYPSVDYSALYPPHLAEPASRPLVEDDRGFLKPINRSEYTGPRFVLTKPLTFMQVARLIDSAGKLDEFQDRAKLIKQALALTT